MYQHQRYYFAFFSYREVCRVRTGAQAVSDQNTEMPEGFGAPRLASKQAIVADAMI